MESILVTFEVSKLLISRDVSVEQPRNIELISVTNEVLKLLRSSVVNPEQSLNI